MIINCFICDEKSFFRNWSQAREHGWSKLIVGDDVYFFCPDHEPREKIEALQKKEEIKI